MSASSPKLFYLSVIRIIGLAMAFSAISLRASAEDFTEAIHAYLQQCFSAGRIDGGCVVGLVDEHGSSVVSYGKMDNGTDQKIDGDTLFEIGSVTKTFTALLLADMVEHGQMKLDDPVAKYLPDGRQRADPSWQGNHVDSTCDAYFRVAARARQFRF